MTKADFLAAEGQTEEEFDAEVDKRTREAMTAQFVLDKVVEKEQLSVNEQELTEHLIRSAQRYGMGPDQFAQQIVQAGQVPVLVGEVVRGKALALVLEKAKVVDESGREVDLEALREDATGRPAGRRPRTRATTTRVTTTRVTTTADRRTAVRREAPRRTPAGALRGVRVRRVRRQRTPPGGEFCVQGPRYCRYQ